MNSGEEIFTLSTSRATRSDFPLRRNLPEIASVAALPFVIWAVSQAYFSNSFWVFVLTSLVLGCVLVGLSYITRKYYVVCMALATIGLVIFSIPFFDIFAAAPAPPEGEEEVQTVSTEPVFTYAGYKENGGSFEAWWKLYSESWSVAHWTIFEKDPDEFLKYLPKPNTCSNFMDGRICVNNLGLIGPDAREDKANTYRIIAVGESTTMGVPLTADYVSWPRVLNKLLEERFVCNRPIEVLNAGIAGYNISDSNIRIERHLVDLEPDLILSYHGYNGFHFLFDNLPEPQAALPKDIDDRPSTLLRSLEYAWRMRAWYASSGGHAALSDEGLKGTDLFAHMDRLVDLSQEYGFDLAFLTYNMAIKEDTPPDVVAFYKRVFIRGERNVIYNDAQTRILKELASSSDAIFVDAGADLNGVWDNNLYTDLVHFTKEGDEVMARNVLDGIEQFLVENPQLECRPS